MVPLMLEIAPQPPDTPVVLPAANGFRGTAHTIPTGDAFQLLRSWKMIPEICCGTWIWGLFVSQNHSNLHFYAWKKPSPNGSLFIGFIWVYHGLSHF